MNKIIFSVLLLTLVIGCKPESGISPFNEGATGFKVQLIESVIMVSGSGDLNGDGKPEQFSEYSPGTDVYLNTSSLGVDHPNAFEGTDVVLPRVASILVPDMDNDGKNDVIGIINASLGTNTKLAVCRQTNISNELSANSFEPAVYFTIPVGTSYIVGDLDNDKKPEIVIYGSSGMVLLKNTSSPGSFNSSSLTAVPFNNTVVPETVSVADANADGKPEVFIWNSGKVYIYKNNSTTGGLNNASFEAPVVVTLPVNYSYMPQAVDMNGDKRADLMTILYGNTIYMFQNTGSGDNIASGDFAKSSSLGSASSSASSTNSIGGWVISDLNKDARPELIVNVGNPTGETNNNVIRVYIGRAGSTDVTEWYRAPVVITPHLLYKEEFRLDAGDFDGDSWGDFSIRSANAFSIYRNVGIR